MIITNAKNCKFILVIILLMLPLLLLSSCASEEKVWQDAMGNNNYKVYLEKFPEGEYREEALWLDADRRNNESRYKEYLAQYPNGIYTEEAFWRIVLISYSLDGFQQYLDYYPDGIYTDEAKEALHDHIYRTATIERRKFDFDRYLEWYPTGEYADIANFASMLLLLSTVKEGTGIDQAATYQPSQPGPHKIMIIHRTDDTDHLFYDSSISRSITMMINPDLGWFGKLPAHWQPQSISEVELVAVIKRSDWVNIETAHYSFLGGRREVPRCQQEIEIDVIEAKTGQIVKTGFFKGGVPMPFPATIENRFSIPGEAVSFETFEKWVKPLVEPR